MAGLLHHLSIHPHAVVIETLGLIRSRILDPSQSLPAGTRAEAFSDTALLQVSLAGAIPPHSLPDVCEPIGVVPGIQAGCMPVGHCSAHADDVTSTVHLI